MIVRKDIPVMGSFEKFCERRDWIKENWSLWIPWPYSFFDKTQWIVRKKVYTIGAFSNTGKSKLAYNLCSKFLKLWLKCIYVSVEEWEEDMFGNISSAYENNKITEQHLLSIEIKNYYWLLLSDSARSVSDIDALIKEYPCDVVFIDYVQWLMWKGSSYEKNAEIALWVQRLAIENNVTIFSLSQLSNSAMKENRMWIEGNIVLLKGAWEYYAGSDVIFILSRDEQTNQMQLKIEKNKLWVRWDIYNVSIDYECNQFSFNEVIKKY